MIKKIKILGLAFIIILLVLSSSGCIDVQLGKELFSERGAIKPEIRLKTVSKANISYAFTSTPAEPLDRYTDTRNINVVQGSFKLKIDIEVSIQPAIEMPSAAMRYVTVIVSFPNGSICAERTYIDSAHEAIVIESPVSGVWIVAVEGQGLGGSFGDISFKDFCSIEITADEPI